MSKAKTINSPKHQCGGYLLIIDSRLTRTGDGPAVRRRRKCSQCGARFTTYEPMPELDDDGNSVPWSVLAGTEVAP